MATAFRTRRNSPSRRAEAMQAVIATEEVEPSSYFRWHAIPNRLFGGVLLVLASPAILLALVAVFITSSGSPIYRQKRVGRGGRIFTIYKIRTMRIDAEARTGPVWTTCTRDPRITRIGRFLRATHLDELPQLINVVAGEMALVGPRPERPEFAEALADEIPGYLNRLNVLPGVTGLAQVNLPPDSDFDSVRRKLVLDLRYVAHASFGLDVRLCLATSARLICMPGPWANRVLGVSSTVDVARHAQHLSERPVQLSNEHCEIVTVMSGSR